MNLKKLVMLTSFLLWSALLWTSSAQAWTLPGVGDYAFEPVVKNVYVMHGPTSEPNPENRGFMNNPGFVETTNGVVVVDPGGTVHVGEHVLSEIKKITNKPVLAVFNTHIHGDHWLGNQAIKKVYPNARIYGHPKMIEQANGNNGADWVDRMMRLTNGLSSGTKVVAPKNAVKKGAVVKVDGQSFRIHRLSTAHTDTDIMIEHVESKTLFLGDNSFTNRLGRFDTSSDMHGNIKTLEYARDLKMNVYVPGHGKSGNVDTALIPFLTYLELIRDNVTKGYHAEKESYQIKKDIVGKFAAYKDWAGFDTNFGKHVSKMYLEVEELEF